jgi:hypothetical protein
MGHVSLWPFQLLLLAIFGGNREKDVYRRISCTGGVPLLDHIFVLQR